MGITISGPGFDTCGGRAIFAMHEFHITNSAVTVAVDQSDPDKGMETIPRGVLVHVTDGVRRAIVPPESWDDYVVTWPACKPIIESARNSFRQKKFDAQKGDS